MVANTKTLIIDFSFMAYQCNASILANPDIDLMRHLVLSQLLRIRRQFSEYPHIILALDRPHSWRKEFFPLYKASRKKEHNAARLEYYRYIDQLTEEFKTVLPMVMVGQKRAEGDDVIAVLSDYLSESEIMIYSADHDFLQLSSERVKQYCPRKRMVIENSDYDLLEHIIRGDVGDGIPNCLSQDNTFDSGQRQITIRQKQYDQIKEDPSRAPFFRRNEVLVDFRQIPPELRAEIIATYEEERTKKKTSLFTYCIQHQLRRILSDLG